MVYVLVGGALAALVTRTVTRSIEDAASALKQVQRGDLDVRVNVGSADEIGVLEDGVNRMVEALRDRNALYRTAADGSVENGYTLRIVNKDTATRSFTVRIEGPEGIVLVEADAVHEAAPEEVLTVPVTLRAPAGVAKGRIDLRVVVESDAGVKAVEETRFFGPF